ncbi:MAG TPA: hypothetical protein VFK72_10525, partial [Nevskia sp.]|nr:hypothetical protein [Nevskia sp.]
MRVRLGKSGQLLAIRQERRNCRLLFCDHRPRALDLAIQARAPIGAPLEFALQLGNLATQGRRAALCRADFTGARCCNQPIDARRCQAVACRRLRRHRQRCPVIGC